MANTAFLKVMKGVSHIIIGQPITRFFNGTAVWNAE
jgi:hypothetical protein